MMIMIIRHLLLISNNLMMKAILMNLIDIAPVQQCLKTLVACRWGEQLQLWDQVGSILLQSLRLETVDSCKRKMLSACVMLRK